MKLVVSKIGDGPSRDCRLVYLIGDDLRQWAVLSLRRDLPVVGLALVARGPVGDALRDRGWGGVVRLGVATAAEHFAAWARPCVCCGSPTLTRRCSGCTTS